MLGIFNNPVRGGTGYSVTALSEDNERLRRSNNMLMSELAHMRKLYNDIIYFVQNHVKPVTTPSNSYPSSLLLSSNSSNVQKQQFSNKSQHLHGSSMNNVGDIDHVGKTKLFGVSLLSKKRLHPEYGYSNAMVENHKARLVLENDDLGLNLMPPSPC